MTDAAGFLWAGLAGGGISASLLAVAAFLGKSQIAHWLNKDIENIKAQHQKDLESAKASYARDLESYRTSLIAQTEALKASQDVKKAMAVRMAEKKFQALDRLHNAADSQARDLLTHLKIAHLIPLEKRLSKNTEMYESQNDLIGAIRMAAPFLNFDEGKKLAEYSQRLANIKSDALNKLLAGHHLSEEQIESYTSELMPKQIEIDQLIRNRLGQMLTMVSEPE
ncbi:hypothetical protein [Delftia sp. ASV31]|uniref:hypothetical protein n=1 Tax=Delftia sp. ASV31 TaxID=2795113 RepID=UPI0018EB90CC|nr:hypothetical protein [Delftia sp. ASV31]